MGLDGAALNVAPFPAQPEKRTFFLVGLAGAARFGNRRKKTPLHKSSHDCRIRFIYSGGVRTGMLIGYARVSKADGSQLLDLQRDALIDAGVAAQRIYEDRASGRKDHRPGLNAGLKALQSGKHIRRVEARPAGP